LAVNRTQTFFFGVCMTRSNARSEFAARRAELMAELFLQELDPVFVSRPTTEDLGYDLLVGFANEKAGTNTFSVQVSATEQELGSRFPIQRDVFNRMIHSNIPALLLVADVKRNRMYYAWLKSADAQAGVDRDVVSIPIFVIDPNTKKSLRKQLAKVGAGVAVAG
jgi:hypothetical protein